MSVNPSIAFAAVALQTDRDTAAETPKYLHGLTGGTPYAVSKSTASRAVSCGNRAASNARVESIEANPTVNTLCYPDVFPLYLYAALGAIKSSPDSTAGAGYHKHVITMGADLPYLTLWGQLDKGIGKTVGCRVGNLQITASGNDYLDAAISLMGIDSKFGLSEIPGELKASCYDGQFITTDCEFKLDTASADPKVALVSEASFTIENNAAAQSSLGRAMPRDIGIGQLAAGVSVTTIPDDFKQFQKMLTGSESATDVSSKVVFGSVYAKFVLDSDAKQYIEIKYDHVPFSAEFPEADPEGNEATIQFTCDSAIVRDAKSSPVTITVVNKVDKYDGAAAAAMFAAEAPKASK